MTEKDKSRDERRDKEVAVEKDVGTEEPKQKKLTLWQKIKKWLSCCCCCCCRCCPCYPEDEEQEALIQFFLQQQGQEGRKQPDLCQKEQQGQEEREKPDLCQKEQQGQEGPDLCHKDLQKEEHTVEQIHVAVETTSSLNCRDALDQHFFVGRTWQLPTPVRSLGALRALAALLSTRVDL